MADAEGTDPPPPATSPSSSRSCELHRLRQLNGDAARAALAKRFGAAISELASTQAPLPPNRIGYVVRSDGQASDASLLRAKALPEDVPIVQAVALMAHERHEFSIRTTAEGAGELRWNTRTVHRPGGVR